MNESTDLKKTQYLLSQVAIHKREVDNLMSTVEELERENLLMMSELFECNVEDLKISRSVPSS